VRFHRKKNVDCNDQPYRIEFRGERVVTKL